MKLTQSISDLSSSGFKLRVPDMLVLDNPPKVVCCMKEWRDDGGDLCLEDNEIVIIKEVVLFSREVREVSSRHRPANTTTFATAAVM